MGTGTLLDDRYRLGELIGAGGMADVHSAVDTRLGREVAVKLFHPKASSATVTRLETEARLLAGLSHPGLVRVFDVAVDNERPYLVMELVRGTTLRGLLDERQLDTDMVARLGMRLAGILDHVHSHGIVHRDVKPSNILIDQDGACYLADFGIARALGGARITATGRCVGTAAYLAPEQIQGETTGPPGDIYSLGLVLLECLTGGPEFDGSDVEAALARLTRSPEIPGWLPPVWVETLAAMTARGPEDRPDAAECGQRLAAAALFGPVERPSLLPWRRTRTLTGPTTTTPARRAGRRPGLVHAGVAAAALVAGGLAALLATGPPSAHPPSVGPPPVSDAATSAAPRLPAPPAVTAATQVIEVPAARTVVVTVTQPESRPKPDGKPKEGKPGRNGKGGNDRGDGDDG
ncbi:serine/threonine-protein kinase [Actinokineospora iranica]|uniref:non-specific serine/threonine protein kinase n=1 Tax=Actinokineospora iranica TaxID=1271860 RepID=A0A1G6WD84_9PSEU|nr:serine/threonine-protein kinase [Actinokineospora iranica]SDD63016.1 Serine/threonine protein kinase [Actinokineospora iranica]